MILGLKVIARKLNFRIGFIALLTDWWRNVEVSLLAKAMYAICQNAYIAVLVGYIFMKSARKFRKNHCTCSKNAEKSQVMLESVITGKNC
jgi:K+ transporter